METAGSGESLAPRALGGRTGQYVRHKVVAGGGIVVVDDAQLAVDVHRRKGRWEVGRPSCECGAADHVHAASNRHDEI
jgi:hypothetical protein